MIFHEFKQSSTNSFIDPVTDRFKALAKLTVVEGAMTRSFIISAAI
jgi:hypothetical protein